MNLTVIVIYLLTYYQNTIYIPVFNSNSILTTNGNCILTFSFYSPRGSITNSVSCLSVTHPCIFFSGEEFNFPVIHGNEEKAPSPFCSLICQDCVHRTKSSFAFCRGQEKCGDRRHTCLKLLIYAAWVLVLSEVLWQQYRSTGGSGHLKNSVSLEYRSVTERGIVFFRGPGVRIQLGNSGQRIIHTHKSLSDVFCWCRTRV